MKSRKLLFLGADNAYLDALKYARSLGVYTIVTDYYSPDRMPGKLKADEYWMIDVAETDALEQRCLEEGVSGIFAGNHEFCLDQCRELCKRLHLPFYASDTGWHAARDKSFYKEICLKCGLDTPRRYIPDWDKAESITPSAYPVIIKPSDSCGQKGLSLVNNSSELRNAYEYALIHSVNKDIIIEDYISGDEIYVFGYIHEGRLFILGISQDLMVEINGRRNFGFGLHGGKYYSYIMEEVCPRFQEVIDLLGCREGNCTFQCIMREGVLYNLEFGYRLDGIRSWRRFRRTCGFDPLEAMVDLALGIERPDSYWQKIHPEKTDLVSTSYVIWGRPGKIAHISGREELYQREDILFLLDNFNEGMIIPEGSNMWGIAFDIIIYGQDVSDLDRKIIEINQNLHFYDEAGKEMLIHQSNFQELNG